MTTRIMSSVVIALLFGATVARGQAPPPTTAPIAQRFIDPVVGLSLEEAVARALEHEPSLRAARAQIDVVRALREQASVRPNPAVSFERREEPGGTDSLTTVGVQWPLDLFRRAPRAAVADRELSATTFDVADRERLLIAEVRMRYGDLLAAIRDLSLLDDSLATLRRQLELLRVRAEEGAAPSLERDLLDVEVRRIESDRLLQAGQTEAALLELKRVIGLKADAPLRIRDTIESAVDREIEHEPTSLASPTAVDQRADVRATAARIDVADAKIDRARREGRIDVSAFASYMRMDAAFPQRAFGPDGALVPIRGQFDYVSAGAMIAVPLFNRNQGALAAARADRAGAAAMREAATLAAETEIAIARARDAAARQAVMVYRTGVIVLARQNLGVVTESYGLGRVTMLEVLAERKRYLDVERAYTNALRAAYDARTALTRALGDRR
jgi:outer membrane protein, heavy metal efflux system